MFIVDYLRGLAAPKILHMNWINEIRPLYFAVEQNHNTTYEIWNLLSLHNMKRGTLINIGDLTGRTKDPVYASRWKQSRPLMSERAKQQRYLLRRLAIHHEHNNGHWRCGVRSLQREMSGRNMRMLIARIYKHGWQKRGRNTHYTVAAITGKICVIQWTKVWDRGRWP